MAVSILDVVLLTPGPRGRIGLPAIYWGPPGVGKTAMFEEASRRRKLALETVILTIRDPSDIGGLPVVTADGVRLEAAAWAKRLAKAGEGILFFDELSCSTPTQQAAALRVMTEGVVGECPLPPGVRVMAAANPEDQAAGGWTLAPPMANRLVHLEFDAPTAEAWGHWLVGDGRDDSSVPVILSDDAWNRAWAAIRASYGGFIQRFPGKLLEVPETDAQRGRAWPSPRSHELAARALAGARALGASDGVGLRLLQGAVGEGVAAEILNYFRELDLPDPEEILAGRAKVPTKRPDQTYASLAGVCTVALIPHKDRNERITRAFEVALDVAAKSADVAASCLRAACDEKVLGPVFRDPRCSQRILAVLSRGPLKELSSWLRA